jgi:hypothetical protein
VGVREVTIWPSMALAVWEIKGFVSKMLRRMAL